MFLIHESLYKEKNNEIIGKRGNYFKTIKQRGPFRPKYPGIPRQWIRLLVSICLS